MSDPALMVGPQDPDNTAELTARYGVGQNAIELLSGVADNQPPELMALLALPTDQERSDALVLDEVKRKAGDLLTREGTYLASAYVKGNDPRSRVVTITYVVESGRTGKAALGSYDDFTQSVASYDEIRRAKMGLRAADAQIGTSGEDKLPPAASPEQEAMREELDRMQRELRELRVRQEEPVEGFSSLNASDAKAAVADFDGSQLDKAEALENARETPRTTVTGAIEKRREELAQQQTDLLALAAARAAGRDPLAEPEPESSNGDGDGDGGSS